MTRQRTRLLVLILAILALPGVASSARDARETPPPPDLSGTWRFNDEVTWRMMQGMREREAGPRGGMRGRPGGGAPPPDGAGAEGGPRRPRVAPVEPPAFLADLDEVTITQQDGAVTITDGSGRSRVLWTDGRKMRDESGPGGPATVRASWKDGSLVVKVKPEKGPGRTESWLVSNDRKRLFLTLTLEKGPPLPMRRAYDQVAQVVEQAPGE